MPWSNKLRVPSTCMNKWSFKFHMFHLFKFNISHYAYWFTTIIIAFNNTLYRIILYYFYLVCLHYIDMEVSIQMSWWFQGYYYVECFMLCKSRWKRLSVSSWDPVTVALHRGLTLIAKDSLENLITDFQSTRVGSHHFRNIWQHWVKSDCLYSSSTQILMTYVYTCLHSVWSFGTWEMLIWFQL